MRLKRLSNGSFELTTRKGNKYVAVYLNDGTFNVWDEQREEVIARIQYLSELFEFASYREYSMN